MPSLGDMVVRIVGDNAEFDSSIDKSQKKFVKFEKSALKVGKNLRKFVTLPILGLGVAAVKAAADMEMQEAAFTTLLGSADKAKTLLKELKTFAAVTPFGLGDLTRTTQTLVGFGIEADKAVTIMKQIGDISQGNGQKLQSLSLAFAQASSTGKLMGQDLLQMINAGFNPLLQISEDTGVSIAELKKQMEKGEISVEMLESAFANATKEGGRFYKGMETASKTLSGQFSTLIDTVVDLGREFGGVLLPTIKNATVGLTRFAEQFATLDDRTKRFILGAGLAAAAVGPLLLIVSKAITTFNILKPAIIAVTVALKAMDAATKTSIVGLAIAGIGLLVGAIAVLKKETRQQTIAQEEMKSSFEGSVAAINVFERKVRDLVGAEKELTEQRLRDLIAAAEAEKATETNTRKIIALDLKIKGYTKRLEELGAVALTVEEREAAAAAALSDAFAKMDQRRALAVKSGEDFDLQLQRRDVLLDHINGLIDEGWKIEEDYIQGVLDKHPTLLGLLEERREVEKEIVEQAIESGEELAAQEEANATKRGEFAAMFLSDKTKEIMAINAQAEEYRLAGISEVRVNEWAKEKKDAINEKYRDAEQKRLDEIKQADKELAQSIVSNAKKIASEFAQAADELGKTIDGFKQKVKEWNAFSLSLANRTIETELNNEREKNRLILESTLDAIDKEMKAKLKAEGLLDKTREERERDELRSIDERLAADLNFSQKSALIAEKEALERAGINSQAAEDRLEVINKALSDDLSTLERAALQAERIEQEKAVRKAEIEAEAEAKRIEAREAAAAEERRINLALAIFNRDLAISQAKIDRASALAAVTGVNKKARQAEITALYEELLSTIASTPLPALASGGIALPQRGGQAVTVAEAGVPELILPLDRLDSVLSQIPTGFGGGADGEGDIHLTVNMDSEPILQSIFPATRDRRVLIDANAVVS